MRELELADARLQSDLRNHPERTKLLVTHATEEAPWGEFQPLFGTSWAIGIQVVSAEAYSNAMHGFLTPLSRELGRDPQASARRVLEEEGACAQKKVCASWDPAFCRPGGARKREQGPPGCYEAPLSEGTLRETLEIFLRVAQAWKEGRHCIIVQGAGFNLK